ncbi:MAG: hypothetical protein IPO20_22950 [Gammaproteobacteria bacterium]|nr:hypothetical protein [Gammaproteobacteria bacterium]
MSFTDATLFTPRTARRLGRRFQPAFDRALFPDTAATYELECIDAFEIGAKNTLLDNTRCANITAFFYDHEGLQVSKIVNRTSFNENADAGRSTGSNRSSCSRLTSTGVQRQHRFTLHTEVKDFARWTRATPRQRAQRRHADRATNPQCLETA